eukprot:GHVU01000584.1.p1 GENE.GHVU01000584.1~~GHVU01000584.1.p1  ORF type:complete len:106 (+),score=9.03 GHVU01000584.1:190-507(+)
MSSFTSWHPRRDVTQKPMQPRGSPSVFGACERILRPPVAMKVRSKQSPLYVRFSLIPPTTQPKFEQSVSVRVREWAERAQQVETTPPPPHDDAMEVEEEGKGVLQ